MGIGKWWLWPLYYCASHVASLIILVTVLTGACCPGSPWSPLITSGHSLSLGQDNRLPPGHHIGCSVTSTKHRNIRCQGDRYVVCTGSVTLVNALHEWGKAAKARQKKEAWLGNQEDQGRIKSQFQQFHNVYNEWGIHVKVKWKFYIKTPYTFELSIN